MRLVFCLQGPWPEFSYLNLVCIDDRDCREELCGTHISNPRGGVSASMSRCNLHGTNFASIANASFFVTSSNICDSVVFSLLTKTSWHAHLPRLNIQILLAFIKLWSCKARSKTQRSTYGRCLLPVCFRLLFNLLIPMQHGVGSWEPIEMVTCLHPEVAMPCAWISLTLLFMFMVAITVINAWMTSGHMIFEKMSGRKSVIRPPVNPGPVQEAAIKWFSTRRLEISMSSVDSRTLILAELSLIVEFCITWPI